MRLVALQPLRGNGGEGIGCSRLDMGRTLALADGQARSAPGVAGFGQAIPG